MKTLSLQHRQTVIDDQSGFASLVIGLILIVVVGLLTVSFAQLTRHEQQQALNKQLASQAYYAAESGINDTVQAITTGKITSASPNVNTNNCLGSGLLPNTPLSSNGVSYTCVIANLTNPDLEYKGISPGVGQTTITDTSATIDQLTINWSSADPTPQNTPVSVGSHTFNDTSSWNGANHPPVIQFSLTPLGPVDRDSLIKDTYTIFLYPNRLGGSNPDYSARSSNQGLIANGNCSSPGGCSVTIGNIRVVSATKYLIHFIGYYDAANVTITAKDSSGRTVNFSGGQATIDVTGKAKDVLKRLQVRVDLSSGGASALPDYALEANNICKREITQNGNTQNISTPSPDPCNN